METPSTIGNQLNVEIEFEDVEQSHLSTESWIVVNVYKKEGTSQILQTLCSDLCYCPYVGLAVPLESQCEGQVFCFLPLPLENNSPTGLPFHVNGFFALSQNRRYVKWPTADQYRNHAHTDKAIEWNKCLVREVLPEVYCSILNKFIQYCMSRGNPSDLVEQLYGLIPPVESVNENWKDLVTPVLDDLPNIPVLYTHNFGGHWVNVQEAIILDPSILEEFKQTLISVYTQYQQNIVDIPDHLFEEMKHRCKQSMTVVSEEHLCTLMRSNDLYLNLPRSVKITILKYVLTGGFYNSLNGLRLLPVSIGSFVEIGADAVYYCEHSEDNALLPGLENILVDSDAVPFLSHVLQEDFPGVTVMSLEVFPVLLWRCLKKHLQGDVPQLLPVPPLSTEWLRLVWMYILKHYCCDQIYNIFGGFLIVPEIVSPNEIHLHTPCQPIIAKSVENVGFLRDILVGALQKLGIVTLSNVADIIPDSLLGSLIKYPTFAGVKRVLEDVTKSDDCLNWSNMFNREASDDERESLVSYLSEAADSDLKGVSFLLRKLCLFLATDGTNRSLETLSILAPEEGFPPDVPYPEMYLVCKSRQYKALAVGLGATKKSLLETVKLTLEKIVSGAFYTTEQQKSFMKFLILTYRCALEDASVALLAKQVKFLTTTANGSMCYQASELFDPDSKLLVDLFTDEDKFPYLRHNTRELKEGLILLGLKQEDDVTGQDINTTVQIIEKVNHKECKKALVKVKALMMFLSKHTDLLNLNEINTLKQMACIPCISDKPEFYPPSLSLFGKTTTLARLDNVSSSKYIYAVGSAQCIAEALTDEVEDLLGMNKPPPTELIISHLHNMSSSYRKEDNYLYMLLSEHVFRELSNHSQTFSSIPSILVDVEDGFKATTCVYIEQTASDIDIKPYMFLLPSAFKQWETLMLHMGCYQKQTPEMLADVLKTIKQKHDFCQQHNSPVEFDRDKALVFLIISRLKDESDKPGNILLPIHNENRSYLTLLPLNMCTYCNADWLKIQSEDHFEQGNDNQEEIFYLHEDISESTAIKLGVISLTDRVLDDTVDIDLDYYQSEPLTTRLRNLLHNYTDGFSIPKELIQNADDAGATEICFLYDERENLDARKFLINEEMASLQGPALWAYNNAFFQDSDFKNIIKLSGATKEDDTTKIGKFGLGFNSVYNLTDVPSFVTGNTMVIFDPHGLYLGRQGLKINVKTTKNRIMIARMKGQFKPYEGIFGCHFKREITCDGTLFRFPLRTKKQAKVSEIKELSYTRKEMEQFLKMFVCGCGNLLLFTQNVKSVKFFHIPANGDSRNPQLLVDVKKTMHLQKDVSLFRQERNIKPQTVLSFVSEEWESLAMKSRSMTIIQNSNIEVLIEEGELTRNPAFQTGRKMLQWHIVWSTGCKEAYRFAVTENLKGLMPLAATAIPVVKTKRKLNILNMSSCPYGFYKEGHYFCFLPLPLEHTFPLHINACFALTDDRRHLHMKTEDDKDVPEADWNTALMKDAVCRAYINGIASLEMYLPIPADTYYGLWPLDNSQNETFIDMFYRLLANEHHRVFLGGQNMKLHPLKEIILLDPSLRSRDAVGFIAQKALEHFCHNKYNVVDVPGRLAQQFQEIDDGVAIKSRIIPQCTFFRDIFFPNIMNVYWVPHDRDTLTQHALSINDQSLNEVIKQSKCIPTSSESKLLKPSECIDPRGSCVNLYSDEDDVIPKGNPKTQTGFCQSDILDKLNNLGTIKDFLPGTSLEERLHSVRFLCSKSYRDGIQRCETILHYLSRSQHFTLYHEDTVQNIQQIQFLPIKKRPSNWDYPWKAEGYKEQYLAKPTSLFDDKATTLIGSTHMVLDHMAIHVYPLMAKCLAWLGVKNRHSIPVESVIQHLINISESFPQGSDMKNVRIAYEIFGDIYEYLHAKLNSPESEEVTVHLESLEDRNVILVSTKLVSPQDVLFKLPVDLNPYKYVLDLRFQRYRKLLSWIGVRDTLQSSDIILLLQRIKEEKQSDKLTEPEIHLFGRITSYLMEVQGSQFFSQEVFLPDVNGFLCPAKNLCLDDCEFVSAPDMRFLHPCILTSAAKLLGVPGKRKAHLGKYLSEMPPFIVQFGQHEDLTRRLQRILEGYPCDSSILKELVQNADDANATELTFIKDFRNLPTERIFGETWEALQGPALCVFNDSYFSEEDFKGIQNLGLGSKSGDPVKTGQYGVGFNAVYHLTDVPSFITMGPDIDETVCILDPNVQYFPWATKELPGGMLKDLPHLKKVYPDVFLGYDIKDISGKGTLFRFPLRSSAMSDKSYISKTEIGTKLVEDLLESFKDDMAECLLFLHKVRKISIAKVSEDGKLEVEYWVEATLSEEDSDDHRGFISHLRKQVKKMNDTGLNEISPAQAEITLNVHSSDGMNEEWLIAHHFGFESWNEIPESVVKAFDENKLQMLPRGGVAVLLRNEKGVTSDIQGKAFCILPLHISTGLPVHVNGHFALDYEARKTLWHGQKNLRTEAKYRSDWNKHVIFAVILPAYISALHAIKTKHRNPQTLENVYDFLEKYYLLFPKITIKAKNDWTILSEFFYAYIMSRKSKVFGVVERVKSQFSKQKSEANISWVSCVNETGFPGYFNSLEASTHIRGITSLNPFHQKSCKDEMKERDAFECVNILKRLNMKIISSPFSVYSQFFKATPKNVPKCVTSDCVIDFLKSHSSDASDRCKVGPLLKRVEDTPLLSVSAVQCLIKFCQSGEDFYNRMEGLPLALTGSLVLKSFDCKNPLLVTRYSDLLEGILNHVLHPDLYCALMPHSEKTQVLRRMDLEIFTHNLPNLLESRLFNDGKAILIDRNATHPSIKWICRLWTFLEEECDNGDQLQRTVNISSWSLLPGTIAGSKTDEVILYPIKNSSYLLDLQDIKMNNDAVFTALVKLRPLCLNDSIFARPYRNALVLPKSIVATFSKPEQILKILADLHKSNFSYLTEDDCQAIQLYFSLHLDKLESSKSLIKELPLFQSCFGNFTSLCDKKNILGFYKSTGVPMNDFRVFSRTKFDEIIYLFSGHEMLYKALGITILTPKSFYVQIVFPQFAYLSEKAKYVHCEFVRDNILNQGIVRDQFILEWKKLKFIKIGKHYSQACDFFSRKNPVFQEMCFPSEFPPFPFNDPAWQRVLEVAGLQTVVSVDHFVIFAKRIEKLGSEGISEDVICKSHVMVSYLWENIQKLEKDGLLPRVKDIKFLVPYIVQEKLSHIHSQPDMATGLISYSESTTYINKLLMWTVGKILGNYADPYGWLHSVNDICLSLNVHRVYPAKKAVLHFKTILTSVEQMSCETLASVHGTVLEVVTAMYAYLTSDVDIQEMSILRNVCTIYLLDERILVHAEEIVLDIADCDSLQGYIYRAPVQFRKYFQVFLQLGASKTVTSATYAKALERLYKQNGTTVLGKKHKSDVCFILKKLFDYLQSEKEKETSNIALLYLPNENWILQKSSELIYADNNYLRDRVVSLRNPFFIGYHRLKIGHHSSHPDDTNNLLPKHLKMKLLSMMVTEYIPDTVKEDAQIMYRSMLRVKKPCFVKGLIRILNHKHHGEDDIYKSTEDQLLNMNILKVSGLSTTLMVCGTPVHGSERQCESFIEPNSSYLVLYVNTENSAIVADAISRACAKLTLGRLGDMVFLIPKLLEAKPNMTDSILDRHNIRPYSYVSRIREQYEFCPSGTFLPVEMHWLLDTAFSEFNVGETVGYEVFDPCIDRDTPTTDPENSPYIIFAVITEASDKHSHMDKLHKLYEVEVEEGRHEQINNLRLYKFLNEREYLRSPSESAHIPTCQPKTLKEIQKDLCEFLVKAWNHCKDSKERTMVVKRLYLQWCHRRTEDEPFSQEACQYIQNIVPTLGEKLTDSKPHFSGEFLSVFWHDMDTRCTKQKKQREHCELVAQKNTTKEGKYVTVTTLCHQYLATTNFPCNQEAKRWLHHATITYLEAKELYEARKSSNLICFICKQAAEKAIVAWWYNRNTKQADVLKNYDLDKLTTGLDLQFSQIATELQHIVRGQRELMCPDKTAFPYLPKDKYTGADMERACKLTHDILQIVEDGLK